MEFELSGATRGVLEVPVISRRQLFQSNKKSLRSPQQGEATPAATSPEINLKLLVFRSLHFWFNSTDFGHYRLHLKRIRVLSEACFLLILSLASIPLLQERDTKPILISRGRSPILKLRGTPVVVAQYRRTPMSQSTPDKPDSPELT